jgi:hypothetical protein
MEGETSIVQKAKAFGSNLLAAAVGVFAEDASSHLARIRRVLHDNAAGPFFTRLGREFDMLVEKGKVKTERLDAPEVRTAMASIVHDLEEEVPDERRLDILRKAFLATAIGDPGDPDGAQALLYMQTARSLTGLQAQVLGAVEATKVAVGSDYGAFEAAKRPWLKSIQSRLRVPHENVVCRELARLGEAMLINVHTDPGNLGVLTSLQDGRALTDYGVAFCNFLKRSDPPPAEQAAR